LGDNNFGPGNSSGCGCVTVGTSDGLDRLAMLALGAAFVVSVKRRKRR
jgi:hypothetical protein